MPIHSSKTVPLHKRLLVSPVLWGSLAGGTYSAMIFGSLRHLADLTGLTPFDMRPSGYTLEQANAFIAKLGPQGQQIYLNQQLPLDTLYPFALAATLILLFQRIKLATFFSGRRFWSVLCLASQAICVATALFDYTENALIWVMLHQNAPLTGGLVEIASVATVLKSATTILALVALGCCLIAIGYRAIFARRPANDPYSS